jgi:ATPase subunit of ABC transporter with duplicated ATPase domains
MSRDEREAAMSTEAMNRQLVLAREAMNRLTLAQQADAFTKDVRMAILRGQIGIETEITEKFLAQAIALELASDAQAGLNADAARWNGIAASYGAATDGTASAMDNLAASLGFTREEMDLLTREIDENRRAQLALVLFSGDDPKKRLDSLSGGEAARLVFCRLALERPNVLILDEPTRGIDVGAKYEIYLIIQRLAAEGKGVIVISSELPELIGICDRIYAISEGRITGEVLRKDAKPELLMSYMTMEKSKK